MSKRITLPQAIARYARPAPARPRPTYPSSNIDWKNYPRPPGWVPMEGMPWMSVYRPGAAGDASRLESLRARKKELLEEGALGNEKHPRHWDALSEFRTLQKEELAIDAPAPTPEPEQKPYVSRLVRSIAEENAYHRQQDALQAISEIKGKPDHPLWNGDHPDHAAKVEEYKTLRQMAYPEEK